MKRKLIYSILLTTLLMTGCSNIKPFSSEITMELGQSLSEDPSQYVSIEEGMSYNTVSMDFSEIDFEKAGVYTINAVYDDKKIPIKVNIQDTIVPEVKLKKAYVIAKPNEDIIAKDLFSEIYDKAETTAGFISSVRIDDLKVISNEELNQIKMPLIKSNEIDENIKINEKIQFAEEGIYNVEVAVQDASRNTATFEMQIYIDGTAPIMTCPKDEEIIINDAEGNFEIGIDGFTCLDNFDGNLAEGEQSVLDLKSVEIDESKMTEKFLATVTATDRAGNISEINWNVTVKNEFNYDDLVKELAGIEDEVIYVNKNKVSDGYHPELAKQIGDMLNASRAEAGLSQLVWDSTLEGTANIRAKEIVSVYSHTRPDGSAFNSMTNNTVLCGENICRYGNGPADIHQAFMNSPDHRNVILTGALTRYAISYYVVNGVPYVVEHFGV